MTINFCSIFFQSRGCVVSKYIMHYDDKSIVFAYYSKRYFARKKQNNELFKRSYQVILRYLYTETIKRRGEISFLEIIL